jgi:predicted transcriptional regulator
MKTFQSVSDSELILLRIIWENGGVAMFADISDALVKKNLDWRKNIIITLLLRLIEKGFVKTNKIGRRNEYTALVSEEDYAATQTTAFVDKVYEGNVKGLINTLIQRDMISDIDREEILRVWKGSDENE